MLSCTYETETLFYPDFSEIGRFIAAGNTWDGNVRTVLDHMIDTPNPVIIESGTNIGATLMQIKLAKPESEVHCFEPSNLFWEALRTNKEANDWRHVYLNSCALSDASAAQTLYNNDSTASFATREYDGHDFVSEQIVKTQRLDEYTKGFTRLDFIKSDTDGHEYNVLKGARHTLERFHPMLYLEFQISQITAAGQDPHEFLEFLTDNGYRNFLLFNNYGQPLRLAANAKEILDTYNEQVRFMDILAVHKDEPAQVEHLQTLGTNFLNGTLRASVRQPINRATQATAK
ncbi:MAG TPA: FkbM family methyltransferase [Candidatus Saccharimonadales bacterium]|nr:FkbM family methyltransferase [Candidatus Saccharimonadales bacterium]